MPGTFKKLVSVLATSTPITKASKEDEMVLKRVSCIHYPLRFYNNKKNEVGALINSGSKVNAMTPTYATKLDLKVCRTNVKAEKIDDSTLEMFGIVLVSFQVEDKLGRTRFF